VGSVCHTLFLDGSPCVSRALMQICRFRSTRALLLPRCYCCPGTSVRTRCPTDAAPMYHPCEGGWSAGTALPSRRGQAPRNALRTQVNAMHTGSEGASKLSTHSLCWSLSSVAPCQSCGCATPMATTARLRLETSRGTKAAAASCKDALYVAYVWAAGAITYHDDNPSICDAHLEPPVTCESVLSATDVRQDWFHVV